MVYTLDVYYFQGGSKQIAIGGIWKFPVLYETWTKQGKW